MPFIQDLNPMTKLPEAHRILEIFMQDDDQIIYDIVRVNGIDGDIHIQQSLESFGEGLTWLEYIDRNTDLKSKFKPLVWKYYEMPKIIL